MCLCGFTIDSILHRIIMFSKYNTVDYCCLYCPWLKASGTAYNWYAYCTYCTKSCHIDGHFVGVLAYTDAITLFAPSRSGIRTLVNVC